MICIFVLFFVDFIGKVNDKWVLHDERRKVIIRDSNEYLRGYLENSFKPKREILRGNKVKYWQNLETSEV